MHLDEDVQPETMGPKISINPKDIQAVSNRYELMKKEYPEYPSAASAVDEICRPFQRSLSTRQGTWDRLRPLGSPVTSSLAHHPHNS